MTSQSSHTDLGRVKGKRLAAEDIQKDSNLICVAITGNCQSMFLASVIDSIPGVRAEYFGKQGRFLPFEGRSAPTWAREDLNLHLASWKEAGHVVLLVEQTWQLAPPIDITELPPIDGLVRFPSVECFGMWPDRKYTPEQREKLSPERMLRLDAAAATKASVSADIDVSQIFEQEVRRVILFDSERHPSSQFFALLVNKLWEETALRSLPAVGTDLARRVEASRSINTSFNHPIDQTLAEQVGFEWAFTAPYVLWRKARAEHAAKDKDAAAESLAALLATEGADPFFLRMVRPLALQLMSGLLLGRGNIDGAIAMRREVIDIDPYNATWWISVAKLFLALRRPDEARTVILESRGFIPNNPRIEEFAGDIEIALGNLVSARTYFERAVTIAPNHISSIRRQAALDARSAQLGLKRAIDTLLSTKLAKAKFANDREKIALLSDSVDQMAASLLA